MATKVPKSISKRTVDYGNRMERKTGRPGVLWPSEVTSAKERGKKRAAAARSKRGW